MWKDPFVSLMPPSEASSGFYPYVLGVSRWPREFGNDEFGNDEFGNDEFGNDEFGNDEFGNDY